LSRIHGFDDPKISFCHKIKEIETRIADPKITLNSFIVSNTRQADIAWWSTGEDAVKAFANHHVLFQRDNKNTYIDQLCRAMVE